MGQRSQLYIRYKNKKNLVAMHLQWNYGYYMINRTYQLLDFIGKNVKSDYSNFKEEHFDIANSGSRREDIEMLQNLIQMNVLNVMKILFKMMEIVMKMKKMVQM